MPAQFFRLPRSLRPLRHARLQTVLVTVLVAQVVGTGVLVGLMSELNSRAMTRKLAVQIEREIADRVRATISDYLGNAWETTAINGAAISQGLLDWRNPSSLASYFKSQIELQLDNDRVLRPLDVLYFGRATDGRFSGAALNRKGRAIVLAPGDDYDARLRPWFRQAVAARAPVWTNVYTDTDRTDLFVSATRPVYDDGALAGVLAVDLTLNRGIGGFLRQLRDRDFRPPTNGDRQPFALQSLATLSEGTAFIVERRTDYLIASSTDALPYRPLDDGAPRGPDWNPESFRLRASESTDRTIRETARALEDRFGAIGNADGSDTRLEIDGREYFYQVSRLDRWQSQNLDWAIVVALPSSAFTADVERNRRLVLLVCTLALAVAALIGIRTARWIVLPIEKLQKATSAMSGVREASPKETRIEARVDLDREDELGELARDFNRMADRIEDYTEQLEEENLRIKGELSVTRRLQQMILPNQEELDRLPDFDIAGYMEPAEDVGGDYYDVLQIGDRVVLAIGDVTGHGLESGVLAIMVQTAVRTLIERGERDPRQFFATLNRTIYANLQRIQCDKTLTFCTLDYHSGRFWLSGQHEELLLVRSGGWVERIATLDLGFPIGLDEHIDAFVHCYGFKLNRGDSLVLYTDGITEAENEGGDFYELDRLCRVISQHWDESAAGICRAIVADVKAHVGSCEIYDDLTLLVLKQR